MKWLKPILFLAIIFCCGQSVAEKVDVVIGHYPPYADKKSNSGLIVDIVQESFASQGVTVSFTFLPVKRAAYSLRADKSLVALSSDILPDGYKDKVQLVSIYNSSGNIIYLNDDPMLSHSVYENAKIGVYQGAEDEIKLVNEYSAEAVIYRSVDAGMKMLINKRINAIFCVELICNSLIEMAPGHSFSTKKVQHYPWELIMNAESDDTAKHYFSVFRKGLMRIKIDGTFNNLLSQYGVISEL